MSAIMKTSITSSSAVIITLLNVVMLFNLIAAHIISPNIADVSSHPFTETVRAFHDLPWKCLSPALLCRVVALYNGGTVA